MRAPGELGFLDADACDIDRPILRDPALQADFEEVGYVVLPLLDAEAVATLVDGYDRLAEELDGSSAPDDYNDTYAEFSIIHSRPEFRRRAYDLITSVLEPAAARHLVDMRPLIANFVNKPPGTGVVPTHQNFSVVDEAEHRSVSVWVALVDCVLENGAMSMLEGSHRSLRGRRGMWAYQAFSQIDQSELDPRLTPVEVRAGDAVILDDALVHYSPPNRTGERRLAIQYVMVPREARPLWFQQVGSSDEGLDIEVWEIDERYFFEFWHGDGDERYCTHADRIVLPQVDLDLAMLDRLLDPAAAAPSPAATSAEPDPAPEPEPAARQRGLRALISRLSK